MRRMIISVVFWTVGMLAVAHAQPTPTSIAVVGVGKAGSWETVLTIANPTDSPLTLQIDSAPAFAHACTICTYIPVALGPHQTVQVTATDLFSTDGFLRTFYITGDIGTMNPTVRARVINSASAQQSIEIPAIRVSTAQAIPTDRSLIFPGTLRTASVHANLVIGSVGNHGNTQVTVNVQAVDTTGAVLGTATFTSVRPDGANYPVNIFLVDVLAAVGVDSLADGDIVVTQTGGSENIWGEPSVIYPAGNSSVSAGYTP